jgi:sarcosine oxidase subunit alpha
MKTIANLQSSISNPQSINVLVIGGGPAGLAAALAARAAGCENLLLLERETALGGILKQCIHNGFGLHVFKEELTGPEYAQRFIDQVKAHGIPVQCGTMVLDVTRDRMVTAVSAEHGLQTFRAKAVVLAMGCRERPRGALMIPGWRPAGVFTAGTAQRLMNIEGWMPGRRVVILGSGDIGLIMARRMTFEGAKVLACVELMPYSSGLTRNVVQCLDDYGIPLLLGHTVVDIHGRERVEGVTVAQVDAQRKPVPGTEQRFDCDTLLLSVGLIPENELSRAAGVGLSPATSGPTVDESLQTDVPGVFACGNVLHVHDLVDHVTLESRLAGERAAAYAGTLNAQGKATPVSALQVRDGAGVRGAVPQAICVAHVENDVSLMFRPTAVFKDAAVVVRVDGEEILRKKCRILTPGEMVSLTLTKALLAQHAQGRELKVEVSP